MSRPPDKPRAKAKGHYNGDHPLDDQTSCGWVKYPAYCYHFFLFDYLEIWHGC